MTNRRRRIVPGALLALVSAVALSAQPQGGGHSVELPPPDTDGRMTLERSLTLRRSIRTYAPGGLKLAELGQLLWAAQGETDPRSGYRTAPSAGATYPIEVYAAVGVVEGLPPGLYRYLPREHRLDRLSADDPRQPLFEAALRQSIVRDAPVVLVVTGVTQRTAGRYGNRAGRYIAMEAGHVSQNIDLQAAALALGTVAVGAFDDRRVATVLGLSRGEEPLYLMPVGRR